MNVQKACKILHIDAITAKDRGKLKRQYHKQALLYHPDKNKTADAEARFKEINEAYQYLNNGAGNMVDITNVRPFVELLEQFIVGHYGENSMINKIVREVVYIYEEYATSPSPDLLATIGEHIKGLDDDVLHYVFDFICRYRHLLRIASSAIDALEKIINGRECTIYRLRPTLADILACKLYKLTVDGAMYYVPLWERINYFDGDGEKPLTVLCDPSLDDNVNIQIDDDALYIWHSVTWESLRSIVDGGTNTLDVAQGAVHVPLELLRITADVQEIRLKGAGVPSGAIDDIQRGDVVVYVQIV